jgi:hypothetical protein
MAHLADWLVEQLGFVPVVIAGGLFTIVVLVGLIYTMFSID